MRGLVFLDFFVNKIYQKFIYANNKKSYLKACYNNNLFINYIQIKWEVKVEYGQFTFFNHLKLFLQIEKVEKTILTSILKIKLQNLDIKFKKFIEVKFKKN